ncbi:Protein CASP [Paramicrosporidium saccamoebae]|uniref:Protein CASP n=1 Tax=Paramicrosporidium saccamoebae TaxID=1246581 RepID=A0A2H9TM56_9FUNG|nr:Protein CASP [Paramicrosporidium saccamoebae]
MEAFEHVLEQWTTFGWERWKGEQLTRLGEIDKEEATLVEKVKQLPEEEQSEKAKDLLKLYQKEIDTLCNKTKASYALYKDLVRLLSGLNDPLPCLQLCLEQADSSADVALLQQENVELRKTLEEANASVRKQAAHLQEASKKDQASAELKEELLTKEQMLAEIHEMLGMVLTNRNEELVIELGRLKKAHEELQKETQTMSDIKSKQEDLKWAEMDVINLNLEGYRRQLTELQRENEMLRAEVESNKSILPEVDMDRMRALEEDVSDLQKKLAEDQASTKNIMLKKDQELEATKKRLEAFKDVEKSLTELRTMKAAEFPDLYDPSKDQTLEAILQQKNKRLESDLVNMRNQHRELQGQIKTITGNLEEIQKKKSEMERIITRYEESAAIAAMPSDSVSVRSMSTDHASMPANDSIMTVLTNQRDRLKKQNQDLEGVVH